MENRIMDSELDITKWEGKRQRLQTAIKEECFRRSKTVLPWKLIMTWEQYEMLKKTPEFGERGEWKYYRPDQRIYWTPWNCLEIKIKD
jgi:hypothetical protein